MSHGMPETLTYLIYKRILLFDRDGSKYSNFILAFNIVISSNCPLIQICDVQVPTFQQQSYSPAIR